MNNDSVGTAVLYRTDSIILLQPVDMKK